MVAGALLIAQNAHAVVLEQKWKAGEKLAYEMALDGTLNVQAPADAPVLWAGVPLEIEVNGKGLASLDTLEVDEFGAGTVKLDLATFLLKAQALGQNGQWKWADGKGLLTLNGKVLNLGKPSEKPLAPPTALVISKTGNIKSLKKLTLAGQLPTETPNDQTPVKPDDAIDKNALMVAGILKTLPSLWPSRDVAVGESWSANVEVPALARKDAKTGETKAFGAFVLTLVGPETVENRVLQRVALKGDLEVTGAQLEKLFPAPKAGETAKKSANVPQLDAANQNLEGDLWFDAAAGKVVRAQLLVGGRAQSRDLKPNGLKSAPSWMDFTGNVQFQLKNGA